MMKGQCLICSLKSITAAVLLGIALSLSGMSVYADEGGESEILIEAEGSEQVGLERQAEEVVVQIDVNVLSVDSSPVNMEITGGEETSVAQSDAAIDEIENVQSDQTNCDIISCELEDIETDAAVIESTDEISLTQTDVVDQLITAEPVIDESILDDVETIDASVTQMSCADTIESEHVDTEDTVVAEDIEDIQDAQGKQEISSYDESKSPEIEIQPDEQSSIVAVSQTNADDISIGKSIEPIVLSKAANNEKTAGFTGWKHEDGKSFWYENGVRQGTEGRGKEIFDPGTGSWYWLDAIQGGAMAVNKEVYMPYTVKGEDNTGKWVRYDAAGRMVKGWYISGDKTYHYDYVTGAMAKGKKTIENKPCWFDDTTGVGKDRVWEKQGGEEAFWYENGVRQGVDPSNTDYRGREIYDPASNAWYWLDSAFQGKKATGKEVYIPYTILGMDTIGKWVRYDGAGRMIKGWYTVDGADIFATPHLAGNRYYYNHITGAMQKGNVAIDGQMQSFDPITGVLDAKAADVYLPAQAPSNVLDVRKYGAVSGDEGDDTLAFRKAVDAVSSHNNTVYVPAGKYVIDATIGVYLKSNMNLIMDRNAVLEVKANSQESYNVLGLRKVNNVNVFGGRIIGERDTHSGLSGESGMGIGVYDSRKVTIAYTGVSSNWGDGIYLGSEGYWYNEHGAKDITIRGCQINNNRRSNISIVDAENVSVNSCDISDAKGTAPQCGINIEPHGENGHIPPDRKCVHLNIRHTTINTVGKGNHDGQFFTFMTIHNPYDKTYISSDDILIDRCTFNGDCGNYSGTNCRMINTVIKGTLYDRQNTRLTNVKYDMIWRHLVE